MGASIAAGALGDDGDDVAGAHPPRKTRKQVIVPMN